jgi:F-type H+-transporting ATPase subunit b
VTGRAGRIAVAGCLLAGPAAAASGEGHGGPGDLLYPVLNLLVLLGVLLYVGRRPVQGFFADRRAKIQEDLDSAAGLLASAESRHAQLQRQLTRLDQELERIRAGARERAEQERARILADAAAAAERIRSEARAAVARETQRARETLRDEAAELALELAAERLREEVTEADRDRLLDEFVARIERRDAGPGPGGPVRQG